jgi:outer membrane receptor protein involved in Fe transport
MGRTSCFKLGLLACAAAVPLVMPGLASAQGQADSPVDVGEVVVTATRTEQVLSKVPVSVAAYTQERMDQQGLRSVDDVARFTPGINFTRADTRNAGSANIAIRGISSTAGSATTGIYIDDTPIQVRSIGFSAFSTFPAVFDLERVEVLRGPQGTLFGAGSEGGTIRFITPQPSLGRYSAYARGEYAGVSHGATNYEMGVAMGGPIVEDKLAFRASAWGRRDGGYVDRVDFRTGALQEADSNYQDSRVLRGALTWSPIESLQITGSLYYQRITNNDTNAYWENLSRPDDGVYRQGNAKGQPSWDTFYLPAVKIDWDLGPVRFVSNTSFFHRNNQAINDYTAFEFGIWAGDYRFPAGAYAPAYQYNRQQNYTQEARFESTDPNARLTWVIGVFYAKNRQVAKQRVQDTYLPGLLGPAFNAIFGGQPLAGGLYTFVLDPTVAHDEQIAGFGQADFKLTEKLKLTAGLRVARTKFDVYANFFGPVVGPPAVDNGKQKETPVTPKFGISYQATDDNLLYASVAKGYRIGGYNPKVGVPCQGTLTGLGLADRPTLFDSDSVWSYEVGAKGRAVNRKLQFNASAFYIDWKNIQQTVGLAACGFSFVANLGSATSKGFDLQASYNVTSNFSINGSVGYNHAEFKETVKGGPRAALNLVTEGDRIAGSPWTATISAQYDFDLMSRRAYIRGDYDYHSRQPGRLVGLNSANGGANLNLLPAPEYHFMSLRGGVELGDANVSVFVRNLFDTNPRLARATTPGPIPNYTGVTLAPRTIGATVTYRY